MWYENRSRTIFIQTKHAAGQATDVQGLRLIERRDE